MCGRFLLTRPSQVPTLFQVHVGLNLTPRYNIAPTQPIATIRASPESGERECVLLRWGLVPSWAAGAGASQGLINACSETAAEKPSFRAAFRRRRCLVPADGFYEWQRGQRKRHPYAVRLKDERPFAFAGLWEHWLAPDGQPLETVALLTTEANDLVKHIHPRMPVILPAEHYEAWLDPQFDNIGKLPPLRPYPAEEMALLPVSDWVNNARHEGPQCLEPRSESQLPLF
jgi:putative SOS response-associated peptidase YedK